MTSHWIKVEDTEGKKHLLNCRRIKQVTIVSPQLAKIFWTDGGNLYVEGVEQVNYIFDSLLAYVEKRAKDELNGEEHY